MKSITAYVGMGSNLGDSVTQLFAAWQVLGEKTGVCCQQLSSPYFTSPVGMESEHPFVNAVGCLSVDIEPLALLDHLLAIETEFGRRRAPGVVGYQDRTLDLDLLYYGERQISGDRLTVPHPYIAERLFVLTPMAEISPDWRDPCHDVSIKEMEENLLLQIKHETIAPQIIKRNRWPADF